MPAAAEAEASVTYDSAMLRLKKHVFKQRVRLREFLVDFDRLRKGVIHPSVFVRGMSLAGLDKVLSTAELWLIRDHYTQQEAPTLEAFCYRDFLADVDAIFTQQNLEKQPLAQVPPEPADLLDRDRYLRSSRDLGPEREARVTQITARIAEVCGKRGIRIKPFFDDAAFESHTAVYGHVTRSQFKQCLSVKVNIRLSQEEADLLCEKYRHEDMGEQVNYICFSHIVDPCLDAFETYV